MRPNSANERRKRWADAYRWALLERTPGITKREAAEAVVVEAKAAEGDGFRVSVRTLEVWSRSAERPMRVPSLSAVKIGRRIRKLRKSLGWTRRRLCRVTGISWGAVTAYECGTRIPVLENVVRLAFSLCVSPAEIAIGVRSIVPPIIRQRAERVTVLALVKHRKSLRKSAHWMTLAHAAEHSSLSVRTWHRIAHTCSPHGLAHKGISPSGKTKHVWWVHRSIVEEHIAASVDRATGGRGRSTGGKTQ